MTLLFVRAAAVWLLLIAAEIVHGMARELWLVPLVGDFHARQIAVLSGSLLILSIVTITIQWMQVPTVRLLIWIGLAWVGLTVGFEIGVGRGAMGYSWQRIASDYNLPAGGLLPLGLLVMALSPWLATRIRGELPSGQR
jgi:hypothetical protein